MRIAGCIQIRMISLCVAVGDCVLCETWMKKIYSNTCHHYSGYGHRHVRWVKREGGGSFARNVDQIRHEFQLYDVTDTLSMRHWLDYYVGLSGLCFDFF